MALKYFSYSYSCHFPSTNIIGYSFVNFWTTQYIPIFICKFLKIQNYLNICSETYFNICLSIFNEKINKDIIYASKNIQCKNLSRGSMIKPFLKNPSISDEYEYSYIWIKWPSNIIFIGICAGSRVQIYLDIHLVDMLHRNIFVYLFGT